MSKTATVALVVIAVVLGLPLALAGVSVALGLQRDSTGRITTRFDR